MSSSSPASAPRSGDAPRSGEAGRPAPDAPEDDPPPAAATVSGPDHTAPVRVLPLDPDPPDAAPLGPTPFDPAPFDPAPAGRPRAGVGGGAGRAPVPARGSATVLVTGASSGIGAAIARRLRTAGGYRLLLNGRDGPRLAAVAEATGGHPVPGDLTAPGAGPDLAHRVSRLAERVDAVVCCAGVGWCGPFAGMPAAAIDRLIEVNLAAQLHLLRALLPAMAGRGSGHVVLIASIAGSVGVGGEAVYSATKAALCGFAEGLRYEVAGDGVRVSVVVPAIVDTPFLARRGAPYTRRYPRVLPPEKVADAVHAVLRRPRDEVFVPRWMRLPAALHGAAPGLYRTLARRFGAV